MFKIKLNSFIVLHPDYLLIFLKELTGDLLLFVDNCLIRTWKIEDASWAIALLYSLFHKQKIVKYNYN